MRDLLEAEAAVLKTVVHALPGKSSLNLSVSLEMPSEVPVMVDPPTDWAYCLELLSHL